MDMWIQDMRYGAIRVGGKEYHRDVTMYRNGPTSSIKECTNALRCMPDCGKKITLEHIKNIWKEGLKWIIIGTGYFEKYSISPEVIDFCLERGCRVSIIPTPMAVKVWNRSKGDAVGLFHIVC